MAVLIWTLLVTVAMLGAGLAALSTVPVRRATGLTLAVVALGGLLLLLGADLVAASWLISAGAAVMILRGATGDEPPALNQAGRCALAGTLAVALFALLYQVVLRVDWAGLPAGPFRAQTAEVGGLLQTADLVLWLGAALRLTVTLVAAARTEDRP
mgnify:FL=1